MSIVYTADVFCDGDGCDEWIRGGTASYTTGLSRRARHNTRSWKWGRVTAKNGKLLDLCPACFRQWRKDRALQRQVQELQVPGAAGSHLQRVRADPQAVDKVKPQGDAENPLTMLLKQVNAAAFTPRGEGAPEED